MSNLSTALWGQLITISLVISWSKLWDLGSSASLVIHMSGTWAGGLNSYIHSFSPLPAPLSSFPWHLRASQGEGRIYQFLFGMCSGRAFQEKKILKYTLFGLLLNSKGLYKICCWLITPGCHENSTSLWILWFWVYEISQTMNNKTAIFFLPKANQEII